MLKTCETCPTTGDWHANRKYCPRCQAVLRRHPRSTLTAAQAAQVLALRNTMTRTRIASTVGITRAQVSRFLREEGLTSNSVRYPAEVVMAVCETYERLGRKATQEQYPEVSIRSIVERYRQFRPRQVRWTDAQRVEAAKMAGLVSQNAQARYFRRPNAYDGSIRALWAKRFQCQPRHLNGLGVHLAWRLVRPGCPAVLGHWADAGGVRAKVLWLDLVRYLRPTGEPIVAEVIETLAHFQAWLHGTSCSQDIQQMIEEREAYEDRDSTLSEWPGSASGTEDR